MYWGDVISIDISNRAYNQLHCKVWCSVRSQAHCIAHLYTDIYVLLYLYKYIYIHIFQFRHSHLSNQTIPPISSTPIKILSESIRYSNSNCEPNKQSSIWAAKQYDTISPSQLNQSLYQSIEQTKGQHPRNINHLGHFAVKPCDTCMSSNVLLKALGPVATSHAPLESYRVL